MQNKAADAQNFKVVPFLYSVNSVNLDVNILQSYFCSYINCNKQQHVYNPVQVSLLNGDLHGRCDCKGRS